MARVVAGVSQAQRDHSRLYGLLGTLPRVMGARLHRQYGKQITYQGNAWLDGRIGALTGLVIPLAATDADICAVAEKQAAEMMRLAGAGVGGIDIEAVRHRLHEAVRRLDIEPPARRCFDIDRWEWVGMGDRQAVARMTCSGWWRRRLRVYAARKVEAEAIRMGFVRNAPKGARIYCSDASLHRRIGQRRRNAQGLENTLAVNEDGEAFTLAELAARSVANPTIRRGELMTRIRGFEEIAKGCGHVGEFVTITCPPSMHAFHEKTGQAIASYDGTTPKQAQAYLSKRWARIRAALARHGVKLYGFRIAEPHHDGTPHWHMIAFFPPGWPGVAQRAARPRIMAIIRRYSIADMPRDRDARKWRVKFKAIDGRGAAGYIAKYVSKNIDGYKVGADLLGELELCAPLRVEAWAATWGIRQFQQFGGPPIGVWRELRRIEAAEGVAEQARSAADAGNFRRYVEVMGGPLVSRAEMPLAMAKVAAYQVGRDGSLRGRVGRYFEVGTEVVGVLDRVAGRVVESARRVWQIIVKGAGNVRKTGAAFGVAVGVGPAGRSPGGNVRVVADALKGVRDAEGGFAFPWTCVNNCTGVEDGKEVGSPAGQGRGGESGLDVPQAGADRRSGGPDGRVVRRSDRAGEAGGAG